MPIVSITATITNHGPNERRIMYIATDNRGVEHTNLMTTSDPAYDPRDYLVFMQGKIERSLAKGDVRAWLKDMSGTPSFEYATRAQYEEALDEIQDDVTEVETEVTTRQTEITDNESKVRA